MAAMTKGERDQLLSLIKRRERVMKTDARERSAKLLAEFDAQSAKIHHWDDDAVWSEVKAKAQIVIDNAKISIAARCSELGIPAEFAPDIGMYWSGRGHNAVAERRAELRRAAKSRIEAMEVEAIAKIERHSLEAQTALIAHGLESETAKAFLETMPALEALMPPIEMGPIQQLVDAKLAERRLRYLN